MDERGVRGFMAGLRNDQMLDALQGAAMLHGDQKAMQELEEADEARRFDGELLSGNQLADLMGVARGANGQVLLVPFINACMRVDQFEGIQALPRDQRIQAVSSAFAALDTIFSSRQ